MSWALIDDGISNHPKFLQAGPTASWLWLCGVTYCRRHHTNGHIPAAALPTLGVPNPRPWMLRLIGCNLWQATESGWLINGYDEFYGDEAAEKAKADAKLSKRRENGRKGGLARAAKQADNPQVNFLANSQVTPKQEFQALSHSSPNNTAEERSVPSDAPKPHPIRDFLALHESLFADRFGQKPPKYSGRDAKIAGAVIERYGADEASALLRMFLRSSDDFVLQAGFGLPVFESRVTRLVMDRGQSKHVAKPVEDPVKAKYGAKAVGQ